MTQRTHISKQTARKARAQREARQALIADVKNAIAHSETGNSDFFVTDRGNFRVTTQYTQTGKDLNGGDYTYYRLYRFENGTVTARDGWSAEFDYLEWMHDDGYAEYAVGDFTADDLLSAIL